MMLDKTKFDPAAMPKLGFGLMRLPRREDGSIDTDETSRMVDAFLEKGLVYFDTAYVYTGSEDAAKIALVDRHPRESYYLATKMNARVAKDAEDCRNQLKVSLERTGAGYFDFYLLHAMGTGNKDLYEEYGCWEYLKEAKKEGLIRHLGFSFHDMPEVLDEILTKHPEAEFVQLQINYADWEEPTVRSRECLEVARKHGKPVVVMEPVKGGTLANPPGPVADVLKAADPGVSPASWAVRYVASQPGVMVVLSGMSNLAQMEDNLSYMGDFRPLDEGEQETIKKAQKALGEIDQIKCTSCHYCTEGCPMSIAIPDIFRAMNQEKIYGLTERAKGGYKRIVEQGSGKASDCIGCGQCEGACPQHLPIIAYLEECAGFFGE